MTQAPQPEADLPPNIPPNISLSERYATFIEQIITDTLKGKISSKEYVYEQLVGQLRVGAGEVFERCLNTRMEGLQQLLQTETDDLKQAKAQRQLRALKPLQEAWVKYQQTQQTKAACSQAVSQLLAAHPEDLLLRLLQILDPNQTYGFNRPQIERLANELSQVAQQELAKVEVDAVVPSPETIVEIFCIGAGLQQGIQTYLQLEPHLLGWLYENPQAAVGFQSETTRPTSPWQHWTQYVAQSLPGTLFRYQAQNQSAASFAKEQPINLSDWVALLVLLRGMQNALVVWFDKQPYSFQAGRSLAASTYLAFAMIWCELSHGLGQSSHLSGFEQQRMAAASFQITLQILRGFAQRDNFPLYGGLLVTLGGEGWRETLSALDQPLRALENQREKARILTVVGYTQQWLKQTDSALTLHQEALELARQANDPFCEIANLNHLSQLRINQRDYEAAINHSQRALFLARQLGDSRGETHASANLGYAEVRLAQQQEHLTPLDLEASLQRLDRGLGLAKKLQDSIPEVYCALGLGVGYLLLDQAVRAQPYLVQCLEATVQTGSLELLGLGHAALAEANFQLNQLPQSVFNACIGVHLLEQCHAPEARQAANLIAALRGKLGQDAFAQLLVQQRVALVARIGVEGFENLANLA